MKAGKPSESVLSRSVLKQLNKESGSGVSRMKQLDYGCVTTSEGSLVMSTQVVAYPTITPARFAVISAINNLACSGVTPEGVSLAILFPTTWAEQELRALVKSAEEAAKEAGAVITNGHTEILSGISEPIIMATAVGYQSKSLNQKLVPSAGAKPGMDLVVTRQIGLGGTAILAKRCRTELLSRYSAPFLDAAENFDQDILVLKEAQLAAKAGAAAMHDASLGGIYGALWEMADRSNVGMEVDLKAIPIRQETVEICEKLEINPYKLYSAGALLIATEKGEQLVEQLAAAQIPSVVIGRTTDGNDRILYTGEEKRFLEQTQPDELYRFRQ